MASTNRVKWFWKILVLATGLAFFGWYIYGVGLDQVGSAIRSLGFWAPLVLLPYFIVYLVDCIAWSQTLPRREIPFLTLLRIRWAGESVNNIFPSASIGGEAVKVYLLRSKGIAPDEGAASAIISKTAQTIAQLAFILIASIVFLFIAKDQPGLRAGLFFVVLCGFVAVAAVLWIQQAGLFRMLMSLTGALRLKFAALEKRKARLLLLDETIIGFYRQRPRQFLASFGLYLCGWMLDMFEIYLVAQLLGMPIPWTHALVVEAFTGIAKAIGMWIPGSLGIQESGIAVIGRLAGLPDTLTAAYALIRRARELIFVAVGMLLLYTMNHAWKTSQAQAAARLVI